MKDNSLFMDFISCLKDLMLSLICDTRFNIILGSTNKVEEFELEYLGDILTTMEGLFAPIATITNFLL